MRLWELWDYEIVRDLIINRCLQRSQGSHFSLQRQNTHNNIVPQYLKSIFIDPDLIADLCRFAEHITDPAILVLAEIHRFFDLSAIQTVT